VRRHPEVLKRRTEIAADPFGTMPLGLIARQAGPIRSPENRPARRSAGNRSESHRRLTGGSRRFIIHEIAAAQVPLWCHLLERPC